MIPKEHKDNQIMCDIIKILGNDHSIDLFIFENDLEDSSRMINTLNFTNNLSGKPVVLLESASFEHIVRMSNNFGYIKASFEPELNYVCTEKPVSTAIYLVISSIYLAVFTITIYYFPVNSPCKRRVPKEKDNPQESSLYLINRLNNMLGSLFVYMMVYSLTIYSCH